MLTTALLVMLATSVAEPAFLSDSAPRTSRLASLDPPLPSYKGWGVEQLRLEYIRLEDARPGVALPITLLLVGATGLAVSLFAYAIALGSFRGADQTANIAFGIGGTTTAAMLSIGIIQLLRGATDRRVLGAQMDAVQRLADGMERDERLLDLWEKRYPGALPPLIGPPPKGPPPPPSAPPVIPGPPIVPIHFSLIIPLLHGQF